MIKIAALLVAVLAPLAACGDDEMPTPFPDGGRAYDAPPGIYTVGYGGIVTVHALDAQGDAAPLRTIEGPSTGFNGSIGIALDHDGLIYIANRQAGTVTVYPKEGQGDLAPVRTLTAPSAEGIAVGLDDDLYVSGCPSCGSASGGSNTIYHFAKGATTSDYQLGGTSNANTMFTATGSIALDPADDTLYVANSFGGNVSVWPPGAQGDVAPTRSFDPGAGNLQSMTFAVGTVFITQPGVVIQQFAASASGTPTPGTIANTAPLSVGYPGGIWVEPNEGQPTIYVADYGSAAIHVIETAGTAPNLTAASVRTIQGATTKLDEPLGIRVIR